MGINYKVCWLSAGVSSFMAGVLAGDVDEWIYVDVTDQHEDSLRFIKDCEKAIGKPITILKSAEYEDVEDCVRKAKKFRFLSNGFTPCTNWLKKKVRYRWEREHTEYNLIYIWGFDATEGQRAKNMRLNVPEYGHEFPLIDRGLSKSDVHGLFEEMFDFPRPVMYDMGYPNNNCVGCTRGGMGYWNKIRKDFPEVFASRSKLEREIGFSILKDRTGPIFLDELDPERGDMDIEVFPECSILCILAEMTEEELVENKT